MMTGSMMRTICLFCGSSEGRRASYRAAAQRLGELIAGRGLGLVYGGGKVGLMGAAADAALAAGGRVIGVMPDFLVAKEIAHTGLTHLEVVPSMHKRKERMAQVADAFIALPGGYGTLDEFCEMLTWAQLGLHQKPMGILNVDHYYDPLLRLFDQAVTEEFVAPIWRAMVIVAEEPVHLLDSLAAARPPTLDKWGDGPVEARAQP